MKTIELEILVTYKGESSYMTFTTGDNLEDAILTFINDEAGFNNTEDFEEVTDLSEVGYSVNNWGDAEDFENLQDIDLLNEIAEESDLSDFDLEIISAGIECGISVSDIAEAYNGKFKSDRDFAEEMAIQLGREPLNEWPYTCINWNDAAQELMYDYCQHRGYYFRNI